MKWIKFGKWKTTPYGEPVSRKIRGRKCDLYTDEDDWFFDLTNDGTKIKVKGTSRLIRYLNRRKK